MKVYLILFIVVALLSSCFDSGTYVEETMQSSSSMLSSSSELSSSIIADNPESPSYSFRLVQEEADSNDGNWQVNDTLHFAIESDSLEDYSCRWELDGRVLADSACDLTLVIEEDGEQILRSFVSVGEEEVWSDSLVFRAEYALLIYTVGMGDSVATGGKWWAGAGQGNRFPNNYSCAGNVYDGLMEQPLDWAGECETEEGQEVFFTIAAAADAQGYEWGWGAFGFDFHPGSEELLPSEKEIFDVSSYHGFCIRYKSNESGWFLMNATYDQYSFLDYGKIGYHFQPSDELLTVCKDWSSLRYTVLGEIPPFAADQVTGMQYYHETVLDTVYAEITIQKIYLY
jgi:hypothetical protein